MATPSPSRPLPPSMSASPRSSPLKSSPRKRGAESPLSESALFLRGIVISVAPKGVPFAQAAVFERQCAKFGGVASRGLTGPHVTHVIGDATWSIQRVKDSYGAKAGDLPATARFLSTSWLIDSLAQRTLANEAPYALLASTLQDGKRLLHGPDTTTSQSSQEDQRASGGLARGAFSIPEYECMRVSRLDTPVANRGLVAELEKLEQYYGDTGDSMRALSYHHAIQSIKQCPVKLQSGREAKQLPFVSDKTAMLVQEYLDTGRISKADSLYNSEYGRTMRLFCKVYGVGPRLADKWYHKGYRALHEVAAKEPLTDVQRIGIELFDDFEQRIPRSEVQEFERIFREHADRIDPRIMHVICGGYRRGKEFSGDIDIIATHPELGKEECLVDRLVDSLRRDGILTHQLQLHTRCTGPQKEPELMRMAAMAQSHANKFDSHEKLLGVYKLPGRPYRRVDIIVPPITEWAFCVLGWTGSQHFERSIRDLAKKRGFHLSSHGLERLANGEFISCATEREIFDAIGLEYREPEERNC
eukprot:Opistho-1_new@38685